MSDNGASVYGRQSRERTSVGGDVVVGKVVHVWGQEVDGNTLDLLLDFAVNLKRL